VVVTENPIASVVIPAHNEATVIARCLGVLAAGLHERKIEVAVIANGCTDATARVARGFRADIPNLTVVELDEASKAAALNAGDAVVQAFPRVYLDADIVLGDQALDGLIEALTTPEARVSSPHISFHFGHAHWVVRQFYRGYAHIPYLQDGLIGLGVYGLSEAGRRRFGLFPDLVADDLFVQRLFRPDERVVCPGTFIVQTPRTIRALVRVRTRTARGSAQLAGSDVGGWADTSRTTGHTLRALLAEVCRRPSEASAVATYAALTLAARMNARRNSETTWFRDDSSRRSQGGSLPTVRARR
jgi:hypothetical protein